MFIETVNHIVKFTKKILLEDVSLEPGAGNTFLTLNEDNEIVKKELPAPPDVIAEHSALTFDDGTNPHGTTKADVGLDNVDNTSDASKPVSTAQQEALDLKANDNAVVKLTGAQTVAGVKTFLDSPIVPAPTTDMQAATKKYVDDSIDTKHVYELTLNKSQINNLHTTPIDFSDIGATLLADHYLDFDIKETEMIVNPDGTTFGGGGELLLTKQTESNVWAFNNFNFNTSNVNHATPGLYKPFNQVSEGRNIGYINDANIFSVISTAEITGGGADCYITFKMYYKIKLFPWEE